MSKFSVKKPYTVVVAVLIVIILGVVSFTKLSTDLLPSMNFPYAIVLTTYPGASPEQVETVVTDAVESSMATVSNIKHITSTSSENLSMVILEFNTNANMDSVTIEMRESLDMIESYWPDGIGSPIIMKINPDMMPVMMAAVSGEGMTTAEVSELYNEKISTDIGSIDGVASVSATGLIESSIQVVLSDEKIEALNDRLMDKINGKFDEAQEKIDQAKSEIESGKAQLESGKNAAAGQLAEAEAQLNNGKDQVTSGETQLAVKSSEIDAQEKELLQMEALLTAAEEQLNQLLASEAELAAVKAAREAAIQTLEEQINNVQKKYDEAGGDAALESLKSQKSAVEAEIEAISANTELPEAEKAQKLLEAQTRKTEIEAKIAALETLKAAVESKPELEKQLDQVYEELAAAIQQLEAVQKAKEELKSTLGDLGEKKAQIQAGKEAIAAGRQAIKEAQAQIDAGKMTLNQAMATLSEKKALATIQMSVAEAKLSMGEMQITQSQAELDQTKDSTLEKADITGILTKDMVKGLLTAQNFAMPAGYVTEEGRDYLVRVGDKFADDEDIGNLVIMDLSDQDLGVVCLKDVADIAVTDNSGEVYAKMNGNPGVLISVEKQNGYSTADVAKRVREYMASDKVAEYGVEITALMDQGIYIDLVIDSVLNNLIIGAILAIIILFIFLKDIRPTLVVAISIPVSVIFAIALMYFSGVTMNIISLSGLALGVGMLVDNSIVVIENIYRLRNSGVPVKKAAIEGAKQVTAAIAASTLTTVCIWAPIVFVEGITKQLFVDLVLTIAYSLLASLIVALTVVPMMASTVLGKSRETSHPLFDKILNRYEKSLRWMLGHKPVVLIAVAVLLVGSVASVIVRGFEFMGSMDSPQISVSVKMDEDTTFDQATAMADEIMERIMAIDGVEETGAMLGSSLSMMSSMGKTSTDSLSFYVILADQRDMSSDEIAREIEDQTQDLECEVSASGSTMDMSALGGSGISVMIKGRDIDTLKAIATDYAEILKNIEGTTDVSDGQEKPSRELRISVDKEKAMAYNLTVAQVYQQIAAVVASPSAATTLTTDTEEYKIYVTDASDEAMDREDIKNLKLSGTDQNGGQKEVALKDIADISDDTGLSSIRHDASQRQITVSCSIDDDHNATLLTREFQKAVSDYALPEGYTVEFSGENETINEAFGQLGQLLALGILIMYLIMVAQFQSLLSPFIVMFTIPLAFTGGFLGLLFTGNRLSVIALVGFVMLCGIIVNNGIVFVDYVNQLRDGGMSKKDALVETGRTRLRPILMTALTTILAMSTMAMGFGDGSELVQPMAIVTIGGMIYGTLLTLYLVPVVYDIFNRKERKVYLDEHTEE
ncbi:MAG: efflux RND transporter permease subunit [Clostridiales bacterium]|nr:efflux RND transporter permease subunit [Clostridiales bacterium]